MLEQVAWNIFEALPDMSKSQLSHAALHSGATVSEVVGLHQTHQACPSAAAPALPGAAGDTAQLISTLAKAAPQSLYLPSALSD